MGESTKMRALLFCLSVHTIYGYDCKRYKSEPNGAYLQVENVRDHLPSIYTNVIDLNYYKKMALAQPCLQTQPNLKIPVLGSSDVDDRAIASASSILSMISVANSTYVQKMIEANVYVAIAPTGRSPCYLPEARIPLPQTRFTPCHDSWGGMNAKLDSSVAVIVRTESILCQNLNGYGQHGGTLIHEFVHALEYANVKIQLDSLTAYKKAYSERGLWKNTYIDKGPIEYLPVGAEIFFESPLNVAYQWPISSREEMKTYDPDMYAILRNIFGDEPLIDGSHICAYTCD